MSTPNSEPHQTADIKTPVVSLDKHGNAKTGLKQELLHYRQQQDKQTPETRRQDTSHDGRQDTDEGTSTKGDPAEYNSDLSAWNWWNNARILAGPDHLLVTLITLAASPYTLHNSWYRSPKSCRRRISSISLSKVLERPIFSLLDGSGNG
jgi:hypothetical protein